MTTTTPDGLNAPATAPASDRAFFGHPVGLGWLAFCEFWERFSYYGMQALLVLYLSQYLFMPEHIQGVVGMTVLRGWLESVTGPRTPQQLASLVFGLYAGLVYLTPLLGGIIADRWLGRTRTVVLGASLMALGHFLMAFDMSFLLALSCLLLGVGAFKGNIAAQVGALYVPGDQRRSRAFQIFLLAVQIAVIASPIVCGTLGEKYAWHYGFGAAGVGMVIGLFVYLAGRRHLPPEPVKSQPGAAAPVQPMGRRGVAKVVLLLCLIPVLMMGSVGNQQYYNAYPLWAKDHIDMVFFGWEVPVTWLQALDAAISMCTMLGTMVFWRWWAERRQEPDELTKMSMGAFIACTAPLMMMLASGLAEQSGQRLSLLWTVSYNLLNNIGFAMVMPVGLALFSRAAPGRLAGLMIGCYYLHLFAGNTLTGWLAGQLHEWPGATFWGVHAALVAGAGALMLAIKLTFGAVLDPRLDGQGQES